MLAKKSRMKKTVLLASLVSILFSGCERKSTLSTQSVQSKPSQNIPPAQALPITDPNWELPEEKQKELWDIEHFVFIFSKKILKPLADAVHASDIAAVKLFFRNDFRGSVVDSRQRKRSKLDHGIFTQVMNPAASEADLDAFLKWIFEERALLTEEVKMSIRIKDMRRMQHENDLVVYNGTIQWTLSGKTATGKLRDTIWIFAVEILIDPESSLENKRVLRRLDLVSEQQNASDGPLFVDVTQKAGLPEKTFHNNWEKQHFPHHRNYTGGIFAADYNDDGWVDLLVTDIKTGLVLYRGTEEGQFHEVTEKAGLDVANGVFKGRVRVVAWADLDNDVDLDLVAPPFVFENRDGTFLMSPMRLQAENLWGVVPADYDRDGRLDLYLTYADSKRVNSSKVQPFIKAENDGSPNVLLRNLGNLRFEDVTAQAGVSGGARISFAAAWFDANHDNWPDLYVVNDFSDNVFFINQKNGTFVDATVTAGLADQGTSMGLGVGDYNGDGQPDLYVSNMFSGAGHRVLANAGSKWYTPKVFEALMGANRGNTLYENVGKGRFQVVKSDIINRVGWAYAGLFLDIDNNGWEDLYAPAGYISATRGEADQ